MFHNLARWIFEWCWHRWSQWGAPLHDCTEQEADWPPDAVQRRRCSKCGMVDQRMIGVAVQGDSTTATT